MPKTKISEYSTTNADNTDIESINIAEGCAPSGINNAIRELMVHLKEFQTGASGDGFTFAGGTLMTGTNTLSGTNVLSGSTTAAFAAGSASAPSIYASGDTNTGIFFPAADTIAFAEGGAEAMRIDSSGRLIIASSAAETTISGSAPVFQVTGSGFNSIGSFTRRENNANGPAFCFAKSRNTSANSYTVVQNGDSLGAIIFIGDDGTDLDTYGAVISAQVDGTPGANDMPGRLIFSTTADGASSTTERMRIDSSGNVGIGTSSATSKLEVFGSSTPSIRLSRDAGNDRGYLEFGRNNSGSFQTTGQIASSSDSASVNNGVMLFSTSNSSGTLTERARITSGGEFLVGATSFGSGAKGFGVNQDGVGYFVKSGGYSLIVGRLTNDGDLVLFEQAGVNEGSISVSGNTVSYNSFAGAHWSQLQQGRGYNPDIPRGTVMSSIGEMAEWKSVVWDEVIEHPAIAAVEAVEGKEAVIDEEGNVIEPAVEAVAAVEGKDAWTETINKREAYIGDLPVGATFTEDGVTKTVVDDGNERLPKVKISDVVGDKAVYGVFQTYDEVQDMLVTALGAFVVRIAAGVTVQIGDLLESNGDGCARVQDDDVIRSKTIGKVTSTVKTATYADGSYTVPCVLYCG